MDKFRTFTLSVFLLLMIGYILTVAKGLLIPLTIAFVIGYFIITLVNWIKQFNFFGWNPPVGVAYALALVLMSLTFWFVLNLVIINVYELVNVAPVYQQRLQLLVADIYQFLKIKNPPDYARFFEGFDLMTFFSQMVFVLTDIAGYAGIILIYVIFILIEHTFFQEKLNRFFKEEKHLDITKKMIDKIALQIQSYLRIKTLISFLTAICSYLILIGVGVDFAVFWAFLIFALNYIPTIGSIIATIFPSILTLLQFGSWVPFAVVTISLVSLHFFVGNFLEPRIMGKSFNLSGLAIILSLSISGAIWGIIGMFLCVPLMVILNIIFSNFSQTRPIAILLSQDGKII